MLLVVSISARNAELRPKLHAGAGLRRRVPHRAAEVHARLRCGAPAAGPPAAAREDTTIGAKKGEGWWFLEPNVPRH